MSGSSSSPSPPPPPPPPPPIHTSKSLWDPVGDPSKLRACASAWRSLGGALGAVAGSLEGSTAHLASKWDGEAHDHFAAWSSKYTAVLHGLVGDCSTMAGHLDSTADYLEEKNNEIHHLYEAMAATAAVGIGLSIVTFGFSDAAAAAAGAAEVAEAEGVLAAIGTFLGAMGESMGATLASFAGRWAVAAAINLTVDEGISLVSTHRLDFSAAMFTSVIDGATAAGAVPGGFLKDIPFSGAARGALAGFGGSVLTTAIDGDPLSVHSLERDLLSAGVSGGLGQTFDWVWPGGGAGATPSSGLIDPATGLPFGESPDPVALLDGNGAPLGSSSGGPGAPGRSSVGIIDPTTGRPFGAPPEPVTLVGPTGEIPAGPGSPSPLVNPATGQPFNAPPGTIVVTDSSGNPVGYADPPALVGPDGKPLEPPAPPAVGVSLPPPREVVEGYVDRGGDVLVEYLMPGPDGQYVVQTLVMPASDIHTIGPAPVGAPSR